MGRPTGVTILAIVQVLAGVLYLIAGSGVVLVGGILGDFYGAIGEAIGLLTILLGVVEFVVA